VGVDFVRKAARSFEKHLDFARADLAQADLFSRMPIENRPSYVADVTGGAALSEGQELCAHRDGSNVTLRSGLTVVATIAGAGPDVLQAITDSYGVATATVQEVHQISGTVEVTLC
jgi:hypothetical protein